MVIPLTDTVAFVLSADTARKLLSVAPSGWNATVSVVLCPFTTEALAGVTVMPVAAVTVLRSSAIDGRPTLVTFTVRVITSFAVTALPILLTQPRNTSTVPFGNTGQPHVNEEQNPQNNNPQHPLS